MKAQENILIEIKSFSSDLINYLMWKDLNPIFVFEAWDKGLITIAKARSLNDDSDCFPYVICKGKKPLISTKLTRDELHSMFYTDFREIPYKDRDNLCQKAQGYERTLKN